MNESWHIPRASLAGSSGNHTSSSSSSNSSNKSHSNPSTVSRNFKIANDSSSHHNNYNNNNNKKLSNIDRQRRADSRLTTAATALTMQHGPHRLDGRWRQSNHNNNNVKVNNTQHQQQQPKRGSHSSQGSSDSNNSSSQSISSGSLLLTAANLERFAEIHKKQNNHNNNNNRQQFLNSNYNTNLMLATMPSNLTKDAVISIEQQQQQNLDFVKTKDMDTVSMASSTHFTMVNGEGGPSRKTSGGGICSRGKQVTVLITTMSLLFLFVIIGMVYALELRAREMPKS
ncbi:homeobox protein 5 isoform X2 [Episyrphus balteatus]|nr:homeobox protein 5 isoform X2 [Episyrphus balteatus]